MSLKTNKKTIFDKLNDFLIAFEDYSLALGMISISIVIFTNVISRYFFKVSLTWAEEFSRYVLIAITFIGVSSCARLDMHVSVDILSNKLSGFLENLHKIVIYSICIVVCLYMSYLSIRFTILQFIGGNVSVAIAIPTWILYSSVSIGFVLSTYSYSLKLFQLLKNNIN